jgi:head-tail adaptor
MSRSPNRAVVLEAPVVTPDCSGGQAVDWVALGTLWVDLRPGGLRERASDTDPRNEPGLRCWLRAAPQGASARPRPGQRLRDGGRVFAILSVTEADARGAWLVCALREEEDGQ